MPNTLCHIALQAPASRMLYAKSSLPWIIAGCIIPDIPWILLRFFKATEILSLYDSRLYCTIQASFFFCVILSFTLSMLAKKIWPVFFVLVGNCFAHLLFDSLQIKLGNGVHLFAPVSWQIFQLDLLWPDNFIFILLSVVGGGYLLWNWKTGVSDCPVNFSFSWLKMIVVIGGLTFYLFGPLLFIEQSEQAGNNHIQTLRNYDARQGKFIEIDREPFSIETRQVITGTGDVIRVEGNVPSESGTVSMRGYFISSDVMYCESFQMHSLFRNWASLLGLFMGCVLWLQSLLVCRRKSITN